MDTTVNFEQHLWTTSTSFGSSLSFQLNWKKAAEVWVNPKDHARRMIDRFIALSRTRNALEA